MKILLISASTPPIGGIGIWTENYLESDIVQNHSLTFFDTKSNKALLGKIFKTLTILNRISKINQSEFDVVHINTGGSKKGLFRDFLFASKCFKKGLKVFFQLHCNVETYYNDRFSIKLLVKLAKQGVSFLVLNDNSLTFLLNLLRSKNFNNRVYKISNFVNHQQRRVVIKETDATSVVFVGHINFEKGVDLVLEASKRFPDVSFKLVGKVEDHFSFVEKNVSFLGEIPKSIVAETMLKSDILILPSRNEGMPLVILEAMSVGLPIVASNVGDISSVLRGTGAFVFDIQNPESFYALLGQMIHDSKKRSFASENEYKSFIEKYETNIVLSRVFELYKQ